MLPKSALFALLLLESPNNIGLQASHDIRLVRKHFTQYIKPALCVLSVVLQPFRRV